MIYNWFYNSHYIYNILNMMKNSFILMETHVGFALYYDHVFGDLESIDA